MYKYKEADSKIAREIATSNVILTKVKKVSDVTTVPIKPENKLEEARVNLIEADNPLAFIGALGKFAVKDIISHFEVATSSQTNSILSQMNPPSSDDGISYATKEEYEFASTSSNLLSGELGGEFFAVVINGVRAYKNLRTGEIIYKDVVLGSGAGGGANKGVVNPEFLEGYDKHLIEVQTKIISGKIETVIRKGNKGIVGGHNFDDFEQALKDKLWNIDDCIISKKPHPTIDGIYEVEYRIPALNNKGEIIPGEFKYIPNPKTIYDPNIISNEEILEWGKEAMKDGLNKNSISVNGREIRVRKKWIKV